MKNHRILVLLLALFTVLSFTSCDYINSFLASRTRNIDPIQVFNSRLEVTRKLVPNDTLFVQVQGLIPGKIYDVACIDVKGQEITKLRAQADENGVIAPSPLWYDIGFENRDVDIGGGHIVKKPVLDTSASLGLQAFNIQVSAVDPDEDTDFALTFWVVFKSDLERPEPIVMAGKNDAASSLFFLENSFQSGEELRIKVEPSTLKNPPEPLAADAALDVYIVPFSAQPIADGTLISDLHPVHDEAFTVAQLTNANGVAFTGDWATIPTQAQGQSFSVILDVDNNGVYNIKKEGTESFYLDGVDGNGVAGFIVVSPVVQTADLIHLNLASNGHFIWDSTILPWGGWDYGYADTIKLDGSDTQFGWDWQYQGYGVKAIWNPYINWGYSPPSPKTASFYYGTYIRLYIIDAGHSLADGTTLDPTDGTSMMYIPVQSSCYNGCGQQTIWRTPLASTYANRGYRLFLDMDSDGKVSDFDMVDDLHKSETTPSDGIGFSIIN